MLLSQRGGVRQQRVGDVLASTQMGDGIGDVGGIPVDDGSDDKVEPGSTALLRFQVAVCDPTLVESTDFLRQEAPNTSSRNSTASSSRGSTTMRARHAPAGSRRELGALEFI